MMTSFRKEQILQEALSWFHPVVVSHDHFPTLKLILTLALQTFPWKLVSELKLTAITAIFVQTGKPYPLTPYALKRYVQFTKSQYVPEKMNRAARCVNRTDIERALFWFRLILPYMLLTLTRFFPMPRPAVGVILTEMTGSSVHHEYEVTFRSLETIAIGEILHLQIFRQSPNSQETCQQRG